MAGQGIGKTKLAQLAALMQRAGVLEADLEERFVRSSGPGGQHVNKTSSAVQLRHGPSGIEVRVQTSRSQALNRYQARERLAERVLALATGEKDKAQREAEKVRRQKRRRSRRAKARMLDDKARAGQQKALRRPPDRH